MKGEKVQPTRISKDEYVKFKQWVQDTHDTTRGHLATEIENALREYRKPNNEHDKLTRIEDDLATIKAAVATPEADGGTQLSEESTRPPDSTTNPGDSTTKPSSNAPRKDKVEYVVSKYYSRSGGSVKIGDMKQDIKREYAFGKGVIEEYVDLIIAELDAERHPKNPSLIVWGNDLESVREGMREEAEKELDELNNDD